MKSLVSYKDKIVGDAEDFSFMSKNLDHLFFCSYSLGYTEPNWCKITKCDCPVDISGNFRDCVRFSNEK